MEIEIVGYSTDVVAKPIKSRVFESKYNICYIEIK
jgi:hypothetical protein